MEQTTSQDAAAPAQPALAIAGDHCAACAAQLAPDQRYCVQCGQRRGPASLPAATPSDAPRVAPAPGPGRRRGRMTVNATFVAGVGTLLLAMGVGVLIGSSSREMPASRASAPVQVITVAGAGGAGGAPLTAAAKREPRSGKASKRASTKAAGRVSGAKISLPDKKVVTVGSRGSGPGYKNGRFTGDFFGGGG